MTSYCTKCGKTLPSESTACAACDPVPDSPPAQCAQASPAGWGFGPVALGVIALIPTALLVASLALLIPLPVATVVSATLLGGAQIFLVWLLAMRTWPPPLAAVGLTRPRLSYRSTAFFAAGAIAGSLLFAQLYTTAATALDWTFLLPPELPDELLLSGAAAVLSVLALAVLTPIAEEIFFRGFLQRGLVNRWGPVPGLVVSAAVFSGLHFSPAVLLPVFVTGLLLGALYWRTGSLWPCIAVHAAQNFVAVLTIMLEL